MDNILRDICAHAEKAFQGLRPFLAAAVTGICYIMFPDRSMMIALCMVLGASLLDIVTKWVAICRKAGGYIKAVKSGKLSSKAMWDGTRIKIFSYLIISILTGMSYRVIYLQQLGIVLASFVYTIMFLREFESNVENLCDSGMDLKWLLFYTRKKSKDLLKQYTDEKVADVQPTEAIKIEGGDPDRRI